MSDWRSPTMVELIEGDTEALEVSYSADRENVSDEALMEAAEKLTLEWASSDEAIVTVDENGNLTAVKGGEATVTVKAGEIFSTCRVTVKVPLKGFEAESEMSLYINGANEEDGITDSKQLNVKPLPANADDYAPTYASADESIATVDKDGVVTAVSNGKMTITVKSGDISTQVEVTVYTVPTAFYAQDMSLVVGNSGELVIEIEGENINFGTDFTYSSADEKVATVDEDGVVTAVGVGDAQITVQSETGVASAAIVHVTAPAARPASNSGNSTGNSASNGGTASGSTGSTGSSGGSSGGSAAPEPAPAAPSGEIDSTNWYLYYDCNLCKGKGHDRFSCPNVTHYHGTGYDEGVCPGCGTIYTAYLAGPDVFRPEGPSFE